MTKTPRVLALALMLGCSAATPAEPSDSSTDIDTTDARATGGSESQELGYIGLLNADGEVPRQLTPEEREAQRRDAEAAQAERRAACAEIPEVAGPPPAPPESSGGSETLQRAAVLFAERTPAPEPPEPGDAPNDWVNAHLMPWVTAWSERSRELDALAQQLEGAERATSAAWTGHMFLDVARAVLSTPAPPEAGTDPELQAAFTNALLGQTEELWESAVQIFGYCERNGGPPWVEHCRAANAWARSAQCRPYRP